ncbi:MAG: hypothetical protein WC986_14545 [Elusimicrobiota bacterium]
MTSLLTWWQSTIAPWFHLITSFIVMDLLIFWFVRLMKPERAPAPAPPARKGTYAVQKCPCGSGYWIVRSNGPNGYVNGPVPMGENLARILREGQ